MNITTSKSDTLFRVIAVDLIILTTICLVPALSHLLAVPFYKLNPMLLCLLAAMVLVRDRRNALLMALLMPVASTLTTGFPTAANLACMIPELLVVATLVPLCMKKMPAMVSVVIAAMSGKVVFYTLRAVLFAPATLVGTNIWLQIGVVVAAAMAFGLVIRRR